MKKTLTLVSVLVALAGFAGLGPAYAEPGDPLPDVRVGLEGDPSDIIVTSGETGKDGSFSFTGLKPGDYKLSVKGETVGRVHIDKKKILSGTLLDDGKGGYAFGGEVKKLLRKLDAKRAPSASAERFEKLEVERPIKVERPPPPPPPPAGP
jgi:hypothetical protein